MMFGTGAVTKPEAHHFGPLTAGVHSFHVGTGDLNSDPQAHIAHALRH